MKKPVLFLFFLFSLFISRAQLSFSEQNIELGTIAEAYEIRGPVTLSNTSAKKLFLLRADADRGVKVYTSKKTLLPGDTCLLVISFIPESAGRFRKKISLVSSDKPTPYEISLSGNINKIKSDDKTACYYFGRPRTNSVAVNTNPIIVPETTAPRDNTNRMPDNPPPSTAPTPVPAATPPPVRSKPKPAVTAPSTGFSETEYHPNNILFLVDVSSSMRDSLKLPLMKQALHTLVNEARNIDTITFVTYSTKVTVLKEAVSGADKATLHSLVDSLKAKGMTSGNKAILSAQQITQKHFISGGNNQIFLATDGEFKFLAEDRKLFKDRQGNKKVIVTTVAFGSDKVAIKNLKDIASKGEGSFIHIETRSGSNEKLLEEIKARSKK